MEKVKTGWYFVAGGRDVFIESERKNKTKDFVKKILKELHYGTEEENIKYVLYALRKANLEVKHCPACPDFGVKEHDYYSIYGKNFGGAGSEDVNDGMTIIIKID